MGWRKIGLKRARDVGLEHGAAEVNNSFNTAMYTDAKLTAGEQMGGEVIREVMKGDGAK